MGRLDARITFLTRVKVDLSRPNPGPMIKTSVFLRKGLILENAAKLNVPVLVSGNGKVITSFVLFLIKAELMLAGRPTVTAPAPERKVDSAQSKAAPEYLFEPAKIKMLP